MIPNLHTLSPQQIRDEITTREKAIIDSKNRQSGYDPSTPYWQNQDDRQHEWSTAIYACQQRLALIENPAPIVGVIQTNNTNLYFTEELCEGINVSWESAIKEHRDTCKDFDCRRADHQEFSGNWESQSDDTILVGSWKLNNEALFVPDENDPKAEYAGIALESVVQVIWSKTTVRVKNMCSPCYPGQADLDSGEDPNGILAYTLPKELTVEII